MSHTQSATDNAHPMPGTIRFHPEDLTLRSSFAAAAGDWLIQRLRGLLPILTPSAISQIVRERFASF
jgi:hypothetical protein